MVSGLKVDLNRNTETFTNQYRKILNQQLASRNITQSPWYPPGDPRGVIKQQSVQMVHPSPRANAVIPSMNTTNEAMASLANSAQDIVKSTTTEDPEQIGTVNLSPQTEINSVKDVNIRNVAPIASVSGN